ncbi:tetratricopeptide repeat protein [Hydrogenobaculum acidophilum]
MSKSKIYSVISLILTAIFVSVGFYFLKKHEKEYNYAASYQLSKVDELLQQKNYQGALNQAQYVAKNYSKSPMALLAMSYEIGISTLANIPINDVAISQDISSKAKTLPAKFLYEERAAYGLYKQGKYQQAISILNTIPNNAFNKPSALLLEAESYEKLNNKVKAITLYNEILKAFPNSYYANVASFRISMLES